jgi:hypothetical protein
MWGTCWNNLRVECYKSKIKNLAIGNPCKSVIWKDVKIPKGKIPRHNFFWIYSIWEEAGHYLVGWGKNYLLLL